MGKRYQIILFILLVIGGIFSFGQTVQAEDTIAWPVEINAVNFPDDEFRNYLLGKDFGEDGKLEEAEIQKIKSINVSEMSSITSLQGIEYFQNLEVLSCDTTKISELDVRNNPNLQYLNCANTEISELDVSKNTNLQELYCDNTKISELDVRNNPNLQYLSCANTEISELDVSNNLNLQYLSCFNTEISELDVRNNPNLQYLSCFNTEISELDVRNNPNLQYLSCSETEISELDVRNNPNLQDLSCNNTKISELDVRNNPNLQYLNCANTEISELDVSKNTNLQYLYCYRTGISELDVRNNPNLQYLYCNTTEISKLDVSNNEKLKLLKCHSTRISNLDLSNTILDQAEVWETSDFSNCKTPVLLLSGNMIDLSQLPGFDANQIVDGTIKNATLTGDKLKVNDPSKVVTYTYDCGKNLKEIFTLEISSYEISYDANDGTGNMNNGTATAGTAFTLPQNSFTAPTGKRFKEWAIGSIGGAKVKAGGTYTFTGATTVYAVWETIPVPVTTYAITFNANGGTGQMPEATATKGTAFTLPQNSFTAPSGKRFKEWAVGSTGGAKVKAGGTYTFTEATTVYALWETIPSTVKDVKKATFKELQLKAKASKTSNKLTWKKVKGADGYIVYGAKRGKKLTEIKASTKGVSYTHKKLSKKTFYQYQVKAYRLVNGEKKIISVSKNIYSVTTGGKYDNAKKLTVKASKLTLKKGKTKTIQAKITTTRGKKQKTYTKAFRYETTNSKVATVSANGKIKARKKGKCTVYVYAQNGLSKAVKVTVK